MDIIKKIFVGVCLILIFLSGAQFALAANPESSQTGDTAGTILPSTKFKEINECERVMFYANLEVEDVRKIVKKREAKKFEGIDEEVSANDVLGCAIKTGDIKLWMIPFYIRYILEFIIGIAGLLVVGGIIYGGYLYLFGALTEQKEQGKKAIINSAIGLVLILSSWAIVSIVIQFVSR